MCSMTYMYFMLPYNACFTFMLHLKNAILCYVMSCSLALIYHHFRKACVLYHSLFSYSKDGSAIFLQNITKLLPGYMASHPKTHCYSISAIRPSLLWIWCVCVCVLHLTSSDMLTQWPSPSHILMDRVSLSIDRHLWCSHMSDQYYTHLVQFCIHPPLNMK
jgi:hypothetical protein